MLAVTACCVVLEYDARWDCRYWLLAFVCLCFEVLWRKRRADAMMIGRDMREDEDGAEQEGGGGRGGVRKYDAFFFFFFFSMFEQLLLFRQLDVVDLGPSFSGVLVGRCNGNERFVVPIYNKHYQLANGKDL